MKLGVFENNSILFHFFQLSLAPASVPLEDTDKRVDGWKSVLLDPNEEGPSKLVNRIEEYALAFTSTANIIHEEDRHGIYSESRYRLTS